MIRPVLRAVERSPLLTLLGLVVAAAAARFAVAQDNVTPWIFTDEFIYSELARNLADQGELLIRDARIYYSTLTPALDAPGYLLGDSATAYDWIKAVNALVMSAAALPAYGLARLALPVRHSLAFAVLVLAWPALAYTGVVMTEPDFFPLVLLFALALARALVRPTLVRQALVLVVLAAALATRLQAVVLVAAVPAAIAYAVLRGAGRDWRTTARARLTGLWPLAAATVLLPGMVLGARAAQGDARSLLGGYGEVETRVTLSSFTDWSYWHIAVVGLSIGLVPLALAAGTWTRFLRRPYDGEGAGAVLVVSLVIAVPMLVQVVVFAINHSERIQERNLFYIEPLVLLVALIGLGRFGLDRPVALVASGLVGLALIDLPVEALLATPPYADTFSLIALAELGRWTGITVGSLAVILALGGVAGTAALLVAPRRVARSALVGGAAVVLIGSSLLVTNEVNRFSGRVAGSLTPEPADWVDRAAGGERVGLIWNGADDPKLVWQAEFWNSSIDSVLAVSGELPGVGVPRARLDPDSGALVPLTPADTLPDERLLVAPTTIELVGTPLARERAGAVALTLWRVDGPPRVAGTTVGLFQDGWTGPAFELRRFDCAAGGAFVVPLARGHGVRQRLRVVSAGAPPRTITLRSPALRPVRLPVTPEPGGTACVARVEVLDTATGAELGNPADPRELGARAGAPRFDAG